MVKRNVSDPASVPTPTSTTPLRLSVVLCTHNPRWATLERVIESLKRQTLEAASWELVLVDNASKQPIEQAVVAWHPNGRVVREERLGLTWARLRGESETVADTVVYVDDDTVLAPAYLQVAADRMRDDPKLGVVGGPSEPRTEASLPPWFDWTLAPLGCRNLGGTPLFSEWKPGEARYYPKESPIGAGMVVRRSALRAWIASVKSDPLRGALGRTGTSLASGEDNDINLTALSHGFRVGYVPELALEHHLPAGRFEQAYLERLAFASSRDWIIVLHLHGITPWRPVSRIGGALRKGRAWLRFRGWDGPAARIRWQGICGQLAGRARVASIPAVSSVVRPEPFANVSP